ncbi:MAG TPA: hypothetical protein VLZ10_08710 [Thermodesulfobacteriota bacterium]|nr:hypothetical protein [Thermodesulfobacteriota bacterium]
MKKILNVVALIILVGCSYNSRYLKGQYISTEQYNSICFCIVETKFYKGMDVKEVIELIGEPQIRFFKAFNIILEEWIILRAKAKV